MPSKTAEPARRGTLRRGLSVQARCVEALMIREMMTKYGRGNIGFFWVVLEPMLLTAGVMILWSIMKSPYEKGIEVLTFVMTGYMPLTLWRHITQAGVFAFRRSATLLYHRNVTFFDVFIARVLLEFLGTTTALTFVIGFLIAAGLAEPMADVGLCILAWILLAALSLGFSLIVAIMTEYSEVAERFIQPFQYLMVPLSGVFFMIDWLPTRGQQIISFNPVIHCFELFRHGFLGDHVPTHYVIWYPAAWALGLFAMGLFGIEKVRDRVHFG